MKSSNTGIRNIAHVDPGKTTLIDALSSRPEPGDRI